MGNVITAHNRKILRKENHVAVKECNCRKGVSECPLNGDCRAQAVVYKAELKVGSETKNYIGLTNGEFKTRFNGHLV